VLEHPTKESEFGLLPTVRANKWGLPDSHGNNNRKGLSEKSGDGLSTWAKKMLPTPTTNDSQNSSLPPSQKDRDGLSGIMLTSGMNGQLNPRFVEWMMGYPTGWTELEDSATP